MGRRDKVLNKNDLPNILFSESVLYEHLCLNREYLLQT